MADKNLDDALKQNDFKFIKDCVKFRSDDKARLKKLQSHYMQKANKTQDEKNFLSEIFRSVGAFKKDEPKFLSNDPGNWSHNDLNKIKDHMGAKASPEWMRDRHKLFWNIPLQSRKGRLKIIYNKSLNFIPKDQKNK